MDKIQTQSQVGPDGVLELKLALGAEDAGRQVTITVEPTPNKSFRDPVQTEKLQRFVKETAGAWQGDRLVRPAQGALEQRDEMK